VSGRRGAYGLALTGVDGAEDLLVPAGEDWPSMELAWRRGGGSPPEQWVRPGGALLCLQTGGQVEVDWRAGRAVFTLTVQPRAADLVHPYLAPVAGLAAHWLRRESFHAGAAAVGSGAWAILGDKEAGKSSLLASLALAGHPVVSDDVLVVDEDRRALLGPRSIDLRVDAARRFGVVGPAGVNGRRGRRRMTAPAPASAPPLAGFVVLRWDDRTAVTRVPAARRLEELAAQRVVGIPPEDPSRLLELACLPMLELRRPRDWRKAGHALDLLVGALAR
jgi:hypothetical protein